MIHKMYYLQCQVEKNVEMTKTLKDKYVTINSHSQNNRLN